MDVRCERCQTEYEVDDASVSDLGTEVQCSDCGHLFVVKRARDAASQSGASGKVVSVETGDWVIETAAGRTLHLHDLTTLHKWIIERRVIRGDRISREHEPWQRLGDSADLVPFFDIVDSAERARNADTHMPMTTSMRFAPATLDASTATLQAPLQAPTPDRNAFGTTNAPLRRKGLLVQAARPETPPLGALPTAADPGHTQVIRIAPAKTHGVLKLFLTMLVAAVVAYTGILWLHHRFQSGTTSHAGTAEVAAPAQPPTAGLPALPAPPSPQSPAATPASPAGAIEPAHAPVVEPIADETEEEPEVPTHLLGKSSAKSSANKPTPTRKARTKPAAPSPANAAAAGEAKGSTPAALAAQGYTALTHRQFARAISLFKQALAGSPSNGTALFGLAEAYRGNGQSSPALQSYRRYVQILPLGPDAGSARYQIRTLESKKR